MLSRTRCRAARWARRPAAAAASRRARARWRRAAADRRRARPGRCSGVVAQPHEVEQLFDPLLALGHRRTTQPQWHSDVLGGGERGITEVWNTYISMSRRSRLSPCSSRAVTSVPSTRTRPGVRRSRPPSRLRSVVLPGPGPADDGHHLARRDVDGDVAQRVHRGGALPYVRVSPRRTATTGLGRRCRASRAPRVAVRADSTWSSTERQPDPTGEPAPRGTRGQLHATRAVHHGVLLGRARRRRGHPALRSTSLLVLPSRMRRCARPARSPRRRG